MRGVIKEVAAAQCGGAEHLQAAVRRGDVRVAQHAGRDLYYFPKVRIGETHSVTTESTLAKGKLTTESTFETMGALMEGVSWQLQDNPSGSTVLFVEQRGHQKQNNA